MSSANSTLVLAAQNRDLTISMYKDEVGHSELCGSMWDKAIQDELERNLQGINNLALMVPHLRFTQLEMEQTG